MTHTQKRFFVHLGRDIIWYASGAAVGAVSAAIVTAAIPAISPTTAFSAAVPVGGLLGLHLYLAHQMVRRAAERLS